jgi:transposase
MDEKGTVLKEAKLPNTKEALHNFLNTTLNGSSTQTKVVLKAGRNWQVMYDLLEEELKEIKLAHTYKIKPIASAKIKTDKIDSRILTHLLRSNLIPEVYLPPKTTQQANRYLRWALIEAIWPAINKSNYLRAYYERIRKEKAANKAKPATARRLATIIYRKNTQPPLIYSHSGLPLADALSRRLGGWVPDKYSVLPIIRA